MRVIPPEVTDEAFARCCQPSKHAEHCDEVTVEVDADLLDVTQPGAQFRSSRISRMTYTISLPVKYKELNQKVGDLVGQIRRAIKDAKKEDQV